jgi:hypothetical protein
MYKKSKVWSNIFFLIPIGISIYYQIYLYSVLIFGVFLFSTLYHYSNETKYYKIDKSFAILLISYNLYLCYISKFIFPYFYIAIIFVIVGLYYLYIKKIDDWQWHISSVIITLLCLLGHISVNLK